MKKGLLNLLIMLSIIFISFSLVSCANDSLKDPKDIIAEQYGNKEYKIEFSNTTLKDPIPSISYTAKNIPTLPTPTRTGYIFQGWYFDSNYVYPYTSESLYLKMKNVTLYAKWEQEKFTKKCKKTLLVSLSHCKLSIYQLIYICELKICAEAFAQLLDIYLLEDCFTVYDLHKLLIDNHKYVKCIDFPNLFSDKAMEKMDSAKKDFLNDYIR